MAEETKMVTEEVAVKGTTKFGINQLGNPTPLWFTWIFRIFFYAASIITFVINTDDTVSAKTAKAVTKYLAVATIAIHGLSKLTGVKVNEDEFKG